MTNPKHTSSDLVERLREVSSVLFDDYGDGTYAVEDYALATKAADRIEALEAENKRMILTIRKLQGHQAALEADNKMLREALIHTAGICNPASGFLKNTTGVRQKHIKNVCDIARAALEARHD